MSVFLAMAYSGNNGFDLIGTSSCEEGAWDNVAEWCKANVEGFPAGMRGSETAITEWLSDNGAAEEVTVEELSDAMFTPGAAAVTLDDGVMRVILCDGLEDARGELTAAREESGNPAAEFYAVPLGLVDGQVQGGL